MVKLVEHIVTYNFGKSWDSFEYDIDSASLDDFARDYAGKIAENRNFDEIVAYISVNGKIPVDFDYDIQDQLVDCIFNMIKYGDLDDELKYYFEDEAFEAYLAQKDSFNDYHSVGMTLKDFL